MSTYATTAPGGFTRNADRAILGGVFAGFAEYFGFNLCVTRILGIIAFCMAPPIAVVAYLAVVFLVPATSTGEPRARRRSRRTRRYSRAARRAAHEVEREQAVNEARERFSLLEERLAKIEKYVTSSRFELDKEFRNL